MDADGRKWWLTCLLRSLQDPVFGIRWSVVPALSRIRSALSELGQRHARCLSLLPRIVKVLDQCRTENSVVHGPGNKSARYAELASDAARKPVPEKARLKNPSEFRLIGKRVPRLDSRAKCDGSQKFGLDLDLPGMKVAVIAHPPVFGGRVKSVADKEARGIEGVRDVFESPSGQRCCSRRR